MKKMITHPRSIHFTTQMTIFLNKTQRVFSNFNRVLMALILLLNFSQKTQAQITISEDFDYGASAFVLCFLCVLRVPVLIFPEHKEHKVLHKVHKDDIIQIC